MDDQATLTPLIDYRLIWWDEFDRPGAPDPARWEYDTEFNKSGWHNGELQYYSAGRQKNARVENGRLIIEAHAEALAEQRDWNGQQYSSTRLITRGRAAWTYGFFEVRAKLPCAGGTWPAVWLLPSTSNPDFSNGEIDIVEHVAHQTGVAHHSVQTGRRNIRRGNNPTAASRVSNACEAFHNYQLHWTADEIELGVDGQRAFSYRRKPGEPQDWPFDAPFYLIINLAIGGDWAGTEGIGREGLPARLEVEHVRVYAQR